MVHLLMINVNSKEIDRVPVTGTPVDSGTELRLSKWKQMVKRRQELRLT